MFVVVRGFDPSLNVAKVESKKETELHFLIKGAQFNKNYCFSIFCLFFNLLFIFNLTLCLF